MINGPELKSRFVGEPEAAIRRVIQQARRNVPSAILIDEMDALMASRRESSSSFENSVVNTLLTEMDGMRAEETVIFIGTTNRTEALDEGFRRPGRFGLPILVNYPSDSDREAIVEQYNRHFILGLTAESVVNLVKVTRPNGKSSLAGTICALSASILRGSPCTGRKIRGQPTHRGGEIFLSCHMAVPPPPICLRLIRASAASKLPSGGKSTKNWSLSVGTVLF